MFGDLLGKMQETQQKMQDAKQRLDNIYVDAQAEGGLVKVRASGNKVITEIHISPQLLAENDKESIEDLVLTAVNRALQQAEAVHNAEMQAIAAQAMGGMPNLGF
jgi:nucleoid-associated protein EbfC